MCSVSFKLPCIEISNNNATGLSINYNDVEHFMSGEKLYSTFANLAHKCLISSQKKLLSSLTSRIECTTYLYTSERSIVQIASIFTTERNTLCNCLVD
ncbi:hypothetical protein D3C73_963720 [compost metagenome]